jgi:hypothetical protein
MDYLCTLPRVNVCLWKMNLNIVWGWGGGGCISEDSHFPHSDLGGGGGREGGGRGEGAASGRGGD